MISNYRFIFMTMGLSLSLGLSACGPLNQASDPTLENAQELTAQTAQSSPGSASTASVATTAIPTAAPANPKAYNEALELGSGAATLAQTAQSIDDWTLVQGRWQRAVDKLKSVAKNDVNYAKAQTKLGEYQRNLSYSQQRIAFLRNPPPVAPIAQATPAPSAANRAATATPSQARRTSEPVVTPQGTLRVPIVRRMSGTPVIEVTFNQSQTYQMIFDTGASHTLITRRMANELGVPIVGQTQANTASHSNVNLDVGEMNQIAVGPITQSNTFVGIGDSIEVGLLGNDFYRNYDVTVTSDAVIFTSRL
jgi:predicted aspartyl protease